ncbi:MAG: transmembrane 220 family protein [Planctomycetota bacterium]|jgi:hypothetical protein
MTIVIRVILALGLGYAAILQHNDPDAIWWALFYGVAALAALLSELPQVPRFVPIGVGLVALVWAAALVPTVLREASYTWNEIERELGGLVLVAVCMGIAAALPRRRPATPGD